MEGFLAPLMDAERLHLLLHLLRCCLPPEIHAEVSQQLLRGMTAEAVGETLAPLFKAPPAPPARPRARVARCSPHALTASPPCRWRPSPPRTRPARACGARIGGGMWQRACWRASA